MKKIIVLVMVSLLSSFTLVQARTYTIGIVQWEPWATAWVAREQGFWQQEGVDVEVRQFDEYETGSIRSFKFGKLDFGVMMLGTALELINRAPNYVILHEHNWSHGGDYFIVANSVKKVQELKGAKIGLYSRTLPVEYFAEKVFGKHGLTNRDVTFYEVSNTKNLSDALTQGTFSAIFTYGTAGLQLINEGGGRMLYTSADFPGVIPEGLVIQRTILQTQPDDVKKILRGWMRAVRWQNDPDNKEEYLNLLQRTMFQDGNFSHEALAQLAQGRKMHTTLAEIRTRDTADTSFFIQDLQAYTHKNGPQGREGKISDFFKPELALQAAEDIMGEQEPDHKGHSDSQK